MASEDLFCIPVSRDLYVQSSENSLLWRLNTEAYTAHVVKLLEYANQQGFTRQDTRLISSTGDIVPLPAISDSAYSAEARTQLWETTIREATFEAIDRTRQAVDTNRPEQIRRALRFGSYVMSNTIAGEPLVFTHASRKLVFSD